MASVSIQFSDAQIQHLIKSLRRLRDPKLAKSIVQRSTRKAVASVLLPAAQAKTPSRTGAMKAGLKIRPIKRSKTRSTWGTRLGYSAKDFVGDEFYASFIELGWRLGKRSKGESDTRKKIPGRMILVGVAESKGNQAATLAQNLIQKELIKLMKKSGKIPKLKIKLGNGRIKGGVSRRIRIKT